MKITKNKKVKNATITIVDGIKFLSKLEAHVYSRLKENNIEFKYAETRYTLIPSFEYDGATIRPITYKPDFVGNTFIVECKGHPTDAWRVREKLVKYRLSLDYPNIKFYIVSSMKAFDNLLNEILEDEGNNTRNISHRDTA